MQLPKRKPGFRRFGLIGYPLGHSLSPVIHHAALNASGLAGDYRLYTIPPHDRGQLEDLLSRLRLREVHGLNVTIPHKQTVLDYIDRLTPAARAIGAVNTLFMQGEMLIGDNTDWAGFWTDVRSLLSSRNASTSCRPQALVLGAGGSARAVVYALIQNGWKVTIAARRLGQAEGLAENLSHSFESLKTDSGRHIEATRLGADGLKEIANTSLIVNTTPVGMAPNADESPWPAEIRLPKGSLVYDLVYNPPVTALIRRAKENGLQAASGLGMLVEQAALAFEVWTGQTAPREVMWKAAQEKLDEERC